MKKTAQTLLTAAIFATALGSSAQSRMQQPAEALGDPIKEVETNLVDVYGPPSMFTTVLPEDTTTAATETVYTVPLYGPPWAFYPKGDITTDNITDARDLTLIKRAAIEGRNAVGYFEYDGADVNHDGVVDREDVRIFREEVLGIPKQEPAVTTTVPGTTVPDGTTIATRRTMHTRTTRETDALITGLLPFTDTGAVALYGPPRVSDWDLIRDPADMESVFSSLNEKNGQQNKTTRTETVEETDGDSAS